MGPPSKRKARLRAIALQRWPARHAPAVVDSTAPLGNGSDVSEEDDDVYVIGSDSAIDDAEYEKAEATVLKWKNGAKLKRPAVYCGQSRWTKSS